MINNLCLLPARRNRSNALICIVSSRFCSQDIRVIKNPELASLKRGTGGRSSFDGNVVTVFGATGFMGRHICNQLGKRGSQLIIPYRCDIDNIALKSIKLMGDLGQVLYQPFNLKDPQSIRKAVKYSNIVINLIGRNYETKNFSYHDTHVTGAAEIAKACREFNVERLIHFSSLNVTENPKRHYLKKLQFLPSKLKGEEAVLQEFPDATIFRPSNIYGPLDTFLWPLCTSLRRTFNKIPLYKKGKETIKQPVYSKDVALGVVKAIHNYHTRGKIYQAIGPERFYLDDIAFFCAQVLQFPGPKEHIISNLNLDPIYFLKWFFVKYFYSILYHSPIFKLNLEQIERESITDVVDRTLPTLNDLGVPLSKLEDKVPPLILPEFIQNPDSARQLKDYTPIESLSSKVINEYAL